MISSPVASLTQRLEDYGGLNATDIANFTNVSKSTVARWRSGTKNPRSHTQLVLSDLSYVILRLTPYYTKEEIRTWLSSLRPQLDGACVMDRIVARRTDEVLDIIDRLDADAYVW